MTSGTVAAARVLARGGRGVTAAAKANPKPTAGATNSRSPPAAATPSGVRQDMNTAAPIIISAGGALAAASFAAGFHLLSPAVFENDGKEEENGRLHRIPNRQLPHEPQIPWSLSSHLYSRALKAFCDMFAGTSRIYPSSCGGGGGSVARCEEREDDDDSASEDELLHRFEARYPTGYTEPERFAQALEYHRSLLFDYLRRWEMGMNHLQPTEQPRSRNHHHPQQHRHPPLPANQTTGEAENHGAGNSGSAGSNIESSSSSTAWPRHVPNACDIPALEFDLKYCLKRRRRRRRHQHGNSDAGSDLEASAKNPAPDQKNNHPMAASSPANPRQDRPDAPAVLSDVCQNVQFRVATYYLSRAGHNDDLRRGFRIVKELAEQGHPDGMCLYGMILMDGPNRVPGIKRRPEEAVRWFQKAATLHRHIAATYELGVANYTGDGTSPDPGHAIRLFQQAAHLGHSGAAYMLGECLLDGVGCDRDRATALEWLLTAAELGHGLARERALMVLLEDHEQLVKEATSVEHVEAGRKNEAMKWLAGQSEEAVINLERRHTIGGAGIKVPSRSTAVKERRKSKVRESRDESSHLFHSPLSNNSGTSTNGSAGHAADAPPPTTPI